ncbi:MAG: menaquinol oxidoreductase, partial [Deltaproteobacteria bacterium]|nr:menaquinol oxidoreductase [Deltaproteobacteria bacterium]
ICVFLGTWIDKGMGMIAGGFTPSPLEHVTEYVPSAPELLITLGVWATGFLILTILYKVAISVKEELAS